MKESTKRLIYIVIGIVVILVVGLGLYFIFNNKQEKKVISNINISSQLQQDFNAGKISVDEYVRFNLYAEYDRDLLKDEYKNLELSQETIDIEYLINNHYDELSQETIKFFAKKINLENITFELDKENEKTSQDSFWLDLFLLKVSAKAEKVTNLNQVILSSSGNFVIWYTTTGDSGIHFKTAKEIADGLESTVKKFESFFGYDYSSQAEIFSEGKTYRNQTKILNNVNIDSNYLKTATQVYLVNYNESSLAQYVSGYGKGKEIINYIFGGDDYGSIVFPYIIIKPSSFDDHERLAQLYNHELFHHYQRHILCGHSNCTLSKDPYYSDSTANWASALVTTKTTNEGFLNEWAQVYRYNSNSLLGRYANQYGDSKVAYAMFVYLYNYSSIVENGTTKIIDAMYKLNFLEYLEDNSTLEERKSIQKEIALKNLTLNYSNNNLNIPMESRAMSNINDTVNIKENDVYIKDVGVGKMGLTYFAINLTSDEAIKITIDKDNNYIDAILVAQNENDDYVIIDSSDNKGNQIIFDTNNYKDYQKLYLITYNNNLTLQNYYSLTIKQIKKNDNQESSSNKNYISLIDCDAYYSEEIDKRVDTYFFDENNNVKRWVISVYLNESVEPNDQYDFYVNHKNYTNVKIKGNLVIAEYTSNALSEYFNNLTRESVIYSHETSCSLSCTDDECSWENNPNLVLNYNPDSIN